MEGRLTLTENTRQYKNTAKTTQNVLNFLFSEGSSHSFSSKTVQPSRIPESLPVVLSKFFSSPIDLKEAALKPNFMLVYQSALTKLDMKSSLSVLKNCYTFLLELSCDKFGSLFILFVLKRISLKKLFIYLNAIKEGIHKISTNEYGSRIMDFLVPRLPRRDMKWLLVMLEKHTVALALSEFGCELICALVGRFEDSSKLIKEILKNVRTLVLDCYGVKVLNMVLRQNDSLVVSFLISFCQVNFDKLMLNSTSAIFVSEVNNMRMSLSEEPFMKQNNLPDVGNSDESSEFFKETFKKRK